MKLEDIFDTYGLGDLIDDAVSESESQDTITTETDESQPNITENNENRDNIRLHSQIEFKEYLDEFVVGQEHVKEKLSTIAYLYERKWLASFQGFPEAAAKFPPLSMLITGPTGTGKTYMCEAISRMLGLPFIRIDCSALSAEGWSGANLSDYLSQHVRDVDLVKGCVIMLDEFDKMGNHVSSSGGGIPALSVQYNLLDLLDGKYNHEEKGVRDLSIYKNSLVIMAGAFESAREANVDKQGIGFQATTEKSLTDWKDIMVKAGIIPELVGRIVCVEETQALTEDQIFQILTSAKDNSVQRYLQAQIPGIGFTHGDMRVLASKVAGSKYGMREINRYLFDMVHEMVIARNCNNKPSVDK